MADPGRVPGAARDAEFRGSVPQAMALEGSLARIAQKRLRENALKRGAVPETPA